MGEKSGRLDDFDIHAYLADFERNALQVQPSEPASYLKAVRANTKIKPALEKLAGLHAEIEELCVSIDEGMWGAVVHRLDNPRLAGHNVKDVLFYAHAAGRISRADFGTAHMALNLKEQHDLEIAPTYKDNVLGKKGQRFEIPSRKADYVFEDLFDEHGRVTPAGRRYISTVAANLWAGGCARALPPGSTPQDLARHLAEVFWKLPPNQRMVAVIEEPPEGHDPTDIVTQLKREEQEDQLFWDRQISPAQMPFNASRIQTSDGKLANDVVYYPAAGLMPAALASLTGRATRPVYVLGRIKVEQLAKFHLAGFHPVIIRDDRVDSNYLAPHDHMAGALDAAMHDECVHCYAASTYTEAQVQACNRALPDAIRATLPAGDAFQRSTADAVIAHLVDMGEPFPVGFPPARFLFLACKLTSNDLLREHVKSRRPAGEFFERQMRQFDVFKSWAAALGASHPELIPPEHATMLKELFEDAEQQIRQRQQRTSHASAPMLRKSDAVLENANLDQMLDIAPEAGTL